MKKLYKKYNVKEVKYNDSKLRRAYHFYLHQTIFDQVLDVLVFFAISFTIIEVISEFIFHLPDVVTHFMHSFSVLVLTIFGLELMREYAIAEQRKDFFKKHWLDFTLVVFLSFYLFAATYFGIAKIGQITKLNKLAKETKHIKIVLKSLRII